MDAITRKDEYLRRLSSLKTERSEWDSHWLELDNYIQPRTSRFQTTDRNKGGKVNQKIIDSTAGFALRTFSSGLMAGMTSPARPWFILTVDDLDLREFDPVKTWLFLVSQRMREVFAKCNAYYVFPTTYRDLGLYGTSAFSLLPDWQELMRAYPFPVGSYVLACSERGDVDTCIREYTYTARQMIRKFGCNACSMPVRDAFDKGNYDTAFEVVHVITPREEREQGKLGAKNKPFASLWFEKSKENADFLLESGYDDFPVIAPRWDVLGEDTYGHSPCMEILGDVKQLQHEQRKKGEAIDKMVDPPMEADVMLKNQRASLLPGDITYTAGLANSPRGGFRPVYEINPRTGELREDIAEIQMRIKRALYEDMMLMFASSEVTNVTAREVEERHQEKLLALGPYMERLNNEMLSPVIERTFSLMSERGMIPPPPREIQGQDLKVEYISLMAQAQKLIGLNGLERLVGFVGNVGAVVPEALDKLDMDQCIDEYAEMVGSPPRAVRSDDQVAEIRAQRQKAQQAQQMAAMAQPMAQAAQGAKALSETDITDVNALTRMLGVG